VIIEGGFDMLDLNKLVKGFKVEVHFENEEAERIFEEVVEAKKDLKDVLFIINETYKMTGDETVHLMVNDEGIFFTADFFEWEKKPNEYSKWCHSRHLLEEITLIIEF
jgi:hypothetical protein